MQGIILWDKGQYTVHSVQCSILMVQRTPVESSASEEALQCVLKRRGIAMSLKKKRHCNVLLGNWESFYTAVMNDVVNVGWSGSKLVIKVQCNITLWITEEGQVLRRGAVYNIEVASINVYKQCSARDTNDEASEMGKRWFANDFLQLFLLLGITKQRCGSCRGFSKFAISGLTQLSPTSPVAIVIISLPDIEMTLHFCDDKIISHNLILYF